MLGFQVYPPKLYPPKTRVHQRKNRHAKPGDGMPVRTYVRTHDGRTHQS